MEEKRKGKFKPGESGNPAGRKVGSRNKRSFAMEAVVRRYGNLKAFYDKMVDDADGGDSEARKALLARIEPPFKPRAMTVILDIEGDSAQDYTAGVLDAVCRGQLPPDEAASLLNAILAGSKLEKLEELEHRINELLESHGKR